MRQSLALLVRRMASPTTNFLKRDLQRDATRLRPCGQRGLRRSSCLRRTKYLNEAIPQDRPAEPQLPEEAEPQLQAPEEAEPQLQVTRGDA